MPGYAQQVGSNGPLSPWWNAIMQTMGDLQQKSNAQQGGGTQGPNILDMWGNTIEVNGSNLRQAVTIGASHGQPGVQVSTCIGTPSAPQAGSAGQTGLVTPTITLTKGSTSATVSSATGLAIGVVIGALSVAPAVTSGYTQALPVGTYITNVTGTTLTLSSAALVSGSGLFCAACSWTQVTYPLPQGFGFAAGPLSTSSATPVTISGSPTVTATLGVSGDALVTVSALISTPANGSYGVVFLTVDGATPTAILQLGTSSPPVVGSCSARMQLSQFIAAYSTGSHTFGLKYSSSTGTCGFSYVSLGVEPI